MSNTEDGGSLTKTLFLTELMAQKIIQVMIPFVSEDWDFPETFNVTTAATSFVAEKLNLLLEIDRKTLKKTFFDNFDENIELN